MNAGGSVGRGEGRRTHTRALSLSMCSLELYLDSGRTIMNGNISLFSFSVGLLLVYRNITDCCVLIVYFATVPNVFIRSESLLVEVCVCMCVCVRACVCCIKMSIF